MNSRRALRSPETTAVVVTCGATPYLRRTLAGIAAQEHLPSRVVIVDVWQKGRDLGTGEDLQAIVSDLGLDSLCKVRVLRAPGAVNFGTAVAQGLQLNAAAQKRADKMHETRTGEIPVILPDTSAGWLWLLHDDSAPHPGALGELLRLGESGPSIGVVGAKQRDWEESELLLEVGIDATRSARRFNPIDEDEIDQGQHDTREDVLAVGLAGAIVRRDVWGELGGLDGALGPFGDGLEFSRRARLAGYRVVVAPGAIVYHRRASYLGLRVFGHSPQGTALPDASRSFGSRRRAQLYNWILAVRRWQLPFLLAWLAVLTLGRAFVRFVGKDLALARAELSAGVGVLSRPDLWSAGRRRIKATRKIPPSQLLLLEASAREIRKSQAEKRRAATERRTTKSAPSELELRELADAARKRRLAAAGVVLVALLGTAIALSDLLGKGHLTGGGLLPSSARLGELYTIVTAGWLPSGAGVPGPVDPAYTLALLPLLTGLTLADLLTVSALLAIPLAAACAWFGAGALTRSVGARAWASIIWAFAPALLIGLGQGRLGPVLAHALLPLFGGLLARALGVARQDVVVSGMVGAKRIAEEPEGEEGEEKPAKKGLRRTWQADQEVARILEVPATSGKPSLGAAARAALVFALLCACAPILLPVGLVLTLLLVAFSPARRRIWKLPLPALVLFGPLLAAALPAGNWEILFGGPGVPLSYSPASVLQTAAGLPSSLTLSGVPAPLLWLALFPILATALVAATSFLRGGPRAIAVRIGWLIALGGLTLALVSPHIAVARGPSGDVVRAWPGIGVSLVLLGLVMAALAGADGVSYLLSRHTFGWRHTSAAALAVIAALSAALAPIVGVIAARTGIPETSLLAVARPHQTPALAVQLAQSPNRGRTLALTAQADGSLRLEVWRADGPQIYDYQSILGVRTVRDPLGRDSVSVLAAEPTGSAASELATTVAAMVAGVSKGAGEALARHSIGVIVVPPLVDQSAAATREALIAALDATAGIAHVTDNPAGAVWRVSTDGREGGATAISRLSLATLEGKTIAALPSEAIGARVELPPSDKQRLVVLSERADPRWILKGDGQVLARTALDWRQAFTVPATVKHVELSYQAPGRPWWQIGQILVIGVVALLALPTWRRRESE